MIISSRALFQSWRPGLHVEKLFRKNKYVVALGFKNTAFLYSYLKHHNVATVYPSVHT